MTPLRCPVCLPTIINILKHSCTDTAASDSLDFHQVTLIDISEAAVKKGLDGIRANLAKMVKKKKITEVPPRSRRDSNPPRSCSASPRL